MLRSNNLNPQIEAGTSLCTQTRTGLTVTVTGWTFQNAAEVVRYFSHHGEHILGGTLMAGEGYNAKEWTNNSVLFTFINQHFSDFQNVRGVISINKRLRSGLERIFRVQYPLWSGASGHTDLMSIRSVKEIGGIYTHIRGTIRLRVRFTIQNGSKSHSFDQVYILGIPEFRMTPGVALVCGRDELYRAYKSAAGTDYPKDPSFPKIQPSQADPNLIRNIRITHKLPPELPTISTE